MCGPPLEKCSLITPPPSPSAVPSAGPQPPPIYKKTISALQIALIVISILLLLAIIATVIFILSKRKQKPGLNATDNGSSMLPPNSNDQEKKVSDSGGMMKRSDYAKLIFLKGEVDRFDLHDLLRASAEVLGSGNLGASYKAVIMNGEALVVKRYKQMNNVGREEFHEHMRRLGRLDHGNLLPVVAYYYRKEEKLLVCNFIEDGSLASHLHGKFLVTL